MGSELKYMAIQNGLAFLARSEQEKKSIAVKNLCDAYKSLTYDGVSDSIKVNTINAILNKVQEILERI